MTDELEKKEGEASIIKWIEVNKIKNEKNVPISFERHPFLIDIYNDFDPIQVCVKSSQIGFSTEAILKTFFLGKTKKYNVIHTLPTVDFSNDFVKSKVDPIITANSEVFAINRKTDSARHKETGLAHFFYRGTFTEKEAITISADVLINDEYDRSDMKTCETFESRLDFSDYKAIWRFSNPSIPDWGIDALFKTTKQFHWFIKCSHCGKWQYMIYPDSLDFINDIFICVSCHKEITDEDRINGMWVPKYRDRSVSGYWISQLFCVWHTAKAIIYKSKNQIKDIFYNFTLGLPYIGSDVAVRREHVIRCLKNRLPSTEIPRVMGIDQGKVFYVAIGSPGELHDLLTLKSWKEVSDLITRYDPLICVIDGLPETEEVKTLQKKFGASKVFPAFYKDTPTDVRTVRWERQTKDKRVSAVYMDRFRTLDTTIRKIYDGSYEILMHAESVTLRLFIDHIETMYMKTATNKSGQQYNIWDSSTGQDHFVHAINYMNAAGSRLEHMKNAKAEVDEKNRPYANFETPEERLKRKDAEYSGSAGMPDYLRNWH